jgi:hypothetical protein
MEIATVIVFIIYIVFPIKTPAQFAPYIDHPMGMIIILMGVLYLFFSCNPVLGVVSLFVAFELLQRSSQITNRVPMIQYGSTESKRMREMVQMNPEPVRTLEEEIIAEKAPIDLSKPIVYTQSSYKPIYENIGGASII